MRIEFKVNDVEIAESNTDFENPLRGDYCIFSGSQYVVIERAWNHGMSFDSFLTIYLRISVKNL